MKAAVVEAPRRVALVDVPPPEPGPGEVLIALEGCGICGSDAAVWEGRPWFEYPFDAGAPGHEGWGVVEAAGDGVAIAPGTRVAAISYRAHAEYDVAPAEAVVPVPAAVGDDPFPGEALGCAMNVFARSDVQPGHDVAVVGVGFLGALLTQLAARAGARVVTVSRREFSLDVARAMGAEEAVPLGDVRATVEGAAALTDGKLFDRVIEAAGVQAALDVAGELTRTRGRLVVAGYHQDGSRTVDMQLWNWRGIDVVNAHERELATYVRGVRAAAAAIEDGTLDPSPLYTHRVPFDRLERAFTGAVERPNGFLKAVTVL
ncbi:MAG TPA: zinc-binding dehydrogenase [Actinomycetota bacterium]|nr:zinc-binding dehydrogenase [Actinomycetota bacterium]